MDNKESEHLDLAQEKFINSSRIEENEISQSTGSITGDGNQDIYQEINFSKSTKQAKQRCSV